MATPNDYLPPALSEDSIHELLSHRSLPRPVRIESLQVAAAFHSIYLLHFSKEGAVHLGVGTEPDGSATLVLRVSGRHMPGIKTRNEVGAMTWVRQHTSIPVPAVVRFDASEDNAIGHEYTILEKAHGVSVDKIYDTLGEDRRRYLVEQLTDYLVQLHSQPWKHGFVGGLIETEDGKIENGPPMEETFWQLPDIQKYWAASEPPESLESLNPLETVASWTAFARQCLDRYVHAIERHPSLASMRDLVPRMQAFAEAITSTYARELDDTAYVFAHKDLHFANIMCDPDTARITAVLDWEFSSVVPAPRWNPVRAFLWNAQHTDESKPEKERLYAVFESVCAEKGAGWLLEQVKMSPKQEAMTTVLNHIRAAVELSARGEAGSKTVAWRKTAEEAMAVFGI